MTSYEFGDWVIYDPGYKREAGRVTSNKQDIGRVTSMDHERLVAFVCYTKGCTASATPVECLRPATEEEIENADGEIGFHRFDETCPMRMEECCYMCKARKG